jgi:stearoyl-CoA desaturase (delta-9 desaturase)
LHWQDLLVLAITYTLSELGVTVGFHRLFTHRSFKTTRAVRALLAVLGTTAVEGPVVEWVATHRKHHRFSDGPGDPHSPHVDQAAGWRGALRGLAHAHVGWMFRGKDMANPRRYARTCWPTATCASSAARSRCGCWSGWRSRSAWASP